MALGEAVLAEALDLLEAALGELALVVVTEHAVDEVVLELVDRARAPESCHGAAQLVGLGRTEACGDDGHLHRLLLEQRHAQRPLQHAFELARILDLLRVRLLCPVLQVGMNHAALDGTGPHDRHFDDEIVVIARLEPGQHRHLRPALDLEHADRVGLAQHVIDFLVGRGHVERWALAVMLFDQGEALAQRCQHAKPQHVEPIVGQHEAADMLGEMAREAAQGRRQLQRQGKSRIMRVEACVAHVPGIDTA